ncbi:LuxR C-terminal-related transcriptional regulator [Paraburkholderia sp. EG286B]|uniref:helix-turn-helix transcriptional regulator n=1 Tax=Paraburkholderia sp. EG286B TaxID=3237011 RepID=UPI0034D2360B
MSVAEFTKESLALAVRLFPQYPAGMQIFGDRFGESIFERYKSPDDFHRAYVGGMCRFNPFLCGDRAHDCHDVETLSERLDASPDSGRYRHFVSGHGIADMVVMSFRGDGQSADTLGWLAYLIPKHSERDATARVLAAARALFPYVEFNLRQQLAGGAARRVSRNLATVNLSTRKMDIARLIGLGLSNKEIAIRLDLAVPTIKCHVTQILARTGLTNRVELIGLVNARVPQLHV